MSSGDLVRYWQETKIERRSSDAYLNATQICFAISKEWYDYRKSQHAQKFIAALSKELNTSEDQLIQAVRGHHTWVHPQIAVDLAFWACPSFAVWLTSWFLQCVEPRPDSCPSLRLTHNQFMMRSETDLHEKVVHFLRQFHPSVLMSPGLGELGTSDAIRLANWRKGYIAGTCDLFVHRQHKSFCGIAFEFKTPGGRGHLSNLQKTYIQGLQAQGWQVHVCDNYDEAIVALTVYFQGATHICTECGKHCASSNGLKRHLKQHGKRSGTAASDMDDVVHVASKRLRGCLENVDESPPVMTEP